MSFVFKRVIPPAYRQGLRRLARVTRHFGLRRLCPVCGSWLNSFAAHGVPAEPEAICPVCRSKAPHRLAAIYFLRNPQLFRPGGVLIHVAPEQELGRILKQRAGATWMRYIGGGITGVGDSYLDLLNLPCDNDSVDLIYCCHVLNSLQEDRAAMREVFRVLHPQGTAILQVPAFYSGPTTLEPRTEQERLEAFRVAGISRCYTNEDYEHRLREAGFDVEAFRAGYLSRDMIERHQIKGEILHVCTKPIPS